MGLPLAKRHEGSSFKHRLFYDLWKRSLRLPFHTFLPMTVRHPERVPETGPLLIVANHQSFLDPPIVGTPLERHLDFIARSGLFADERFGRLIHTLNAIPIKEEGGDAAAMKEALRRLGAGRAVLLFPEGSRTFDGAIGPFKRGVAVLVKRARCPVLPVAVEGAFDAWPRTRRLPRLGARVAVMYGHPIPHDELIESGADAALARLRADIDRMRLELREILRAKTGGRYPAPGPGDHPISESAAPSVAADPAPAPTSAV